MPHLGNQGARQMTDRHTVRCRLQTEKEGIVVAGEVVAVAATLKEIVSRLVVSISYPNHVDDRLQLSLQGHHLQ